MNSVSYGWPEALTCDGVTNAQCTNGVAAYLQKSELELQKLGAIGVTVVVCSQDEGAPSEHNTACLLDLVGKPLWPVYPGSSAFATSVSGTTLMPLANQIPKDSLPICQKGYPCSDSASLEEPCQLHNTYYGWTTGGGFSEYIPQPTYQGAAVGKYLKSGVEFPCGLFKCHYNKTARMYPEVCVFLCGVGFFSCIRWC